MGYILSSTFVLNYLYSDLRQGNDGFRRFQSNRNGFPSPDILFRDHIWVHKHKVTYKQRWKKFLTAISKSCLVLTFILVDLAGGLAAVHVQQVQDALLVLGDAARDEYLQITVGGQHLNTYSIQNIESNLLYPLPSRAWSPAVC